MADLMLDSDVVIWHLRGRRAVADLVAHLSTRSRLGISAITRTEVLAGARDREMTATLSFLDACETLPVDAGTADLAGRLIQSHGARGITIAVPDAVIAASAISASISLYTCNAKHYPVAGLDMVLVEPRASS